MVSSLLLHNCHGTVFTTDIKLGLKTLAVVVHTSFSGLWVVDKNTISKGNQTSDETVQASLTLDNVEYVSTEGYCTG